MQPVAQKAKVMVVAVDDKQKSLQIIDLVQRTLSPSEDPGPGHWTWIILMN